MAGGTAAACCCSPCVTLEVAVLALVHALATLCCKAARARRGGRRSSSSAGQVTEMYELLVDGGGVTECAAGDMDDSTELEKELWATP